MIWQANSELCWGDSASISEYRNYGINSIICAAEELELSKFYAPFVRLPLKNGQSISQDYQNIFLSLGHILIRNSQPLLVYCHGGCNRSAALVFLYLIKIKERPRKDIWELLKSKRPDVLSWSSSWDKIVELGE